MYYKVGLKVNKYMGPKNHYIHGTYSITSIFVQKTF